MPEWWLGLWAKTVVLAIQANGHRRGGPISFMSNTEAGRKLGKKRLLAALERNRRDPGCCDDSKRPIFSWPVLVVFS